MDGSDTQAHTTGTSKSPLTLYAPLFDEIKEVVDPDEERISESLSLLHELSLQTFSEIPPDLRPELAAAIQTLANPATLPSAQAAATLNFLRQFEQMCVRYDKSVTDLDSAVQFFSAKDVMLESLKGLHKEQMRITNSVDAIRKEKDALGKRMTELNKAEFEYEEEYGRVGKQAELAKTEWDRLVAKHEEMVELRDKAELDKSKAERSWRSFISLFKSV